MALPVGGSSFRVLIVGAGVAGLEAALALDEAAGDRVSIQLLTPETEYVTRPLEVREPFAGRSAPRYDLAAILGETAVEIVPGALAGVDPVGRVAWTRAAEGLRYDALVLALGARPEERRPHVRLLRPGHLDEGFHGFVQDVEEGYIRSAAFIMPDRVGWPLPLYELLLMTAERADAMWDDIDLTLVTSEAAPLEEFGSAASLALVERLTAAGVEIVTSALCEIPAQGRVVVDRAGNRSEVTVDAVVGLPQLCGPALSGLPADDHGFVPVDAYGRVRGAERVFAAGDLTDGPLKLGGVAAQQAEVVAYGVAQLAGADVEPNPSPPSPGGVLLTGGRPLPVGKGAKAADANSAALTDDRAKVDAPRLNARLERVGELPRDRGAHRA